MGIDYGTSSLKALAWDTDAERVLSVRAEEIPYAKKGEFRAEQDPKTVLDLAFRATKRLLRETGLSGSDVKGIAFSGQMHGVVGLDRQSRPSTAIITWEDGRGTRDMLREMLELAPSLLERSGCGLATGYLASTAWHLKKERKDLFLEIENLLLPGDWLRTSFGTTSKRVTDPSNGSSSGLFDTQARDWNVEAAVDLDLNPCLFPKVLESFIQADVVSQRTAEATGLKQGTPLFVGGGDQPLSMLGSGMASIDGSLLINVGTSSQVAIKSSQMARKGKLISFCFPGSGFSILGAGLSGGAALRWLRDLIQEGCGVLYNTRGPEDSYARLCDLAKPVPPGAEGLFFLPLLAGARHAPEARASFSGILSHHRLGHWVRAVMEGVVWELKDFAEDFPNTCSPPSVLTGSGGGMSNPLWADIAASIFCAPIRRTVFTEQAALGASLLAGVGLGIYRDVEISASRVPLDRKIITPSWSRAYADLAPGATRAFNTISGP